MMADAVRIISQIALSPNAATSAPIFKSVYGAAAFISNGFNAATIVVGAGIPQTFTIPSNARANYVAFFVDDLNNPQPMQLNFTSLSGPGPTNVFWNVQFSAANPYVSNTDVLNSNFVLTNLGTGTTQVRLFYWGT